MPTIAHRARAIREDVHEKLLNEFDFKMGKTLGKIIYLIAAEDYKLKASETKSIKIEEITIPPNHMASLCPYARHTVGHIIAIGEEIPMPIEEKRSADYCLFVSGIEGEVRKGDLIGVISLVPIEPIKSTSS
ncbi:MAG: DUF22 domain-containing protein [Halobacteriota archaeon]|nr:DUF22 domain-containing protein [Halobacteriota archaeon]